MYELVSVWESCEYVWKSVYECVGEKVCEYGNVCECV